MHRLEPDDDIGIVRGARGRMFGRVVPDDFHLYGNGRLLRQGSAPAGAEAKRGEGAAGKQEPSMGARMHLEQVTQTEVYVVGIERIATENKSAYAAILD